MKRVVYLLFSILCISLVSALTQITDCDGLQAMSDNLAEDYELSNDIDCSDTSTWNDGAGFLPVGNTTTKFTGSLDGNYKVISNLFIDRSTNDYVGLFGYTNGASIQDVGLTSYKVNGSFYLGGLIGRADGTTTIKNTYVKGTTNGSQGTSTDRTGGIVGYLYGGWINNSYAESTVTCNKGQCGGLVGSMALASVNYSYFSGEIIHTDVASGWQGGISGGFTDSNISNSMAIFTTLQSVSKEGGIVGNFAIFSYTSNLHNVYWNNVSNNPDEGYDGGNDNCTAIADNQPYFYDTANPPMDSWNYTDIWCEGDSTDFPTLRGFGCVLNTPTLRFRYMSDSFDVEDGTFHIQIRSEEVTGTPIYNCSDLQNMNDSVTEDYVLMNDIDCSDTINWNDGAGFLMIGNATRKFSGSFDGQGYTISDLYHNNVSEDFSFIRTMQGAKYFRNVNFDNVTIFADDSGGLFATTLEGNISHVNFNGTIDYNDTASGIGCIIGNGWDTNISNTSVNCNITSRGSGPQGVGLLAGYFQDGIVNNSYSAGYVEGGVGTAGLVGSLAGASIISHSYSNAIVENTTTTAHTLGCLSGSGGSGHKVYNSFGNCSVASVNWAGGLIGDSQTYRENLYWNNHSGNPDVCNLIEDNCTTIQDNESYFYDITNPPMDTWSFPPWDNANDGVDLPVLSNVTLPDIQIASDSIFHWRYLLGELVRLIS